MSKDHRFMFGALSVFFVLLVNSSVAPASNRDASLFLAQDPFNQVVITDSSAEDMAAYIASVQEWNQLIPQKYRDLPEVALVQKESFNFESLTDRLNSLEFGILNSHLAALHRSSRVRRYMAVQRRLNRQLLAGIKSKISAPLHANPMLPSGPSGQVLEVASAASGLLEEAHSQLSLSYPDIFADQLDLSSAHPTAAESGYRVTPQQPSLAEPRMTRSYVEAFDNQTAVGDGSSEVLSKEAGETGWYISSGFQHLPTLEWIGDPSRDLETPLMSENTSRILGRLAGTTIQRDAGLIFGKLAAGWKIEFSGRAEVPVYLDSNLRIVTSDDVSSERYFVFLNAAPGAHLIYLTPVHVEDETKSEEAGVVAFPVMGGTATYLNLTHITYSSFAGQVVLVADGAEETSALSHAAVRLVGLAGVSGVTNRKGYFHFDNVVVASDYPIFVETDKGGGFTHRYRILPKNLQNATLFRLSRHQISDWVNQIEGGISTDSGIILAVVPGVVAHRPNVTLVPSVRSIIPTLRMIPETYTLTPTDLLQPRTALEADENRFLGVEVPEGPVLAQVSQVSKDKKGVVWSELTITSPAVVTLIGPY